MLKSFLLIIALVTLPLIINAQKPINSTPQKRTLVLLEDWHSIDTHSLFWSQLRKLSYQIDFKIINDTNIKLTYFGEYLYSNIIYFAPSYNEDLSSKSDISITNLLKFLDDGHDLMIFGSKESGSFIRKLVNEFGVDFDDYDSQVKDSLYLHNLKDSLNKDFLELKNNEIIVTKNAINVPVLTKLPKNYILYEGIGMEVDPQNSYVFPILKADENSYSINPKTGEVYSNGDKIKLVTGYQSRNNRRVVVLGSMNLCSDMFYYLSSVNPLEMLSSSNANFCADMQRWAFQLTGLLRFDNIRHRRKEDGVSLPTYRIKDELEYFIDVYEYDYKTDNWKPYITDDLQLEYVMMNPYYISQMRLLSTNQPTYFVSFKSPEKFGVFKFMIEYKRLGYSYILSSTKVPLRPFNHNEYMRFLPCAYPYYLSVFVMLGAFVLFSVVFVYGKNNTEATATTG